MAAPRPPPARAPTPAPSAAPAPVPSSVLSVVVRWVAERPAQPGSSPVTSSRLAVFRIMSSLLGPSSTVSASPLLGCCQGSIRGCLYLLGIDDIECILSEHRKQFFQLPFNMISHTVRHW